MRVARALFGDRVEPAIQHEGHWVRAGVLAAGKDRDVLELLGRRAELLSQLADADLSTLVSAGDAVPDEQVDLRQPLLGPRAIVAVGLNYRDHVAEVSWEAPPTPLLFAKWPSSLTGPYDRVALDASISSQVDYEVELAAVIGQPTLDVPVDRALGQVAGYTIANDLSARDIQTSESQWTRAKSFDGFCPIGPWVTTADEVPDPQRLQLSSFVNGTRRQHASTEQMIHGVAELVAFASRATTLMPGDLILTGTPSGVALGASDPQWLKPGDVVRIEIETLGHLENQLVDRGAR